MTQLPFGGEMILEILLKKSQTGKGKRDCSGEKLDGNAVIKLPAVIPGIRDRNGFSCYIKYDKENQRLS